ncbi:MAG: hydrogenase nickel incorporation protein HypB [Desulfobulbaceae bacterium]|nr:hydrogenase nickel incorporation protein HypB [Desulfobulbaceae bacterium]HIJ89581.1 hydrogenase nickel incorporation protein HypB [Deltaproteobacteria bacterium]
MCDSCNCSQPENGVTIKSPGRQAMSGSGSAGRHHSHQDLPREGRLVEVREAVLGKNDGIAAHNREFFRERRIVAFNLVSSPGSGKTTILERTIRELHQVIPIAVIEGDQQTMLDAERIDATGVPVVQVNTGAGCHLDADMVHQALHQLEPAEDSLLFIENVGNLVCPAMFDLGEAAKVVIISVTEGEDKPLKYPAMFDAASLCLINKTDLLPHVDFDVARCREYGLRVNHRLEFFEISARSGEGMSGWLDWLRRQL